MNWSWIPRDRFIYRLLCGDLYIVGKSLFGNIPSEILKQVDGDCGAVWQGPTVVFVRRQDAVDFQRVFMQQKSPRSSRAIYIDRVNMKLRKGCTVPWMPSQHLGQAAGEDGGYWYGRWWIRGQKVVDTVQKMGDGSRRWEKDAAPYRCDLSIGFYLISIGISVVEIRLLFSIGIPIVVIRQSCNHLISIVVMPKLSDL